MAVRRNDPCLCGSGKKYKKCCLKQKNIVQLKEHKEEQFYRQKHLFVEKLNAFLNKEIPLNEYYQLQSEFRRRTNRKVSEGMESGFLRYWLYFFRRFDNGLRGIEWFYEEAKSRLSEEERTMAERWIGLSPKLVEAVSKSSSEILFEDIYTREQFPSSSSKENILHCLPWYSTYGLMEPFQGQYYFNGVKVLGSPKSMRAAATKADEFIEQYKMTRKQVLQDFYPEILAEFIDNGTIESYEVQRYIAKYSVTDETAIAEFLKSERDITIEQWSDAVKIFAWTENWRAYIDNEMNGEVQLADLYGTIELRENQLITSCNSEYYADELKAKLNDLEAFISLVNEEVQNTKTFGADIDPMFVNTSQHTPEYFALYAQNRLISDIDYPIRGLDGFTIRELVENGRVIEAETWLKQMEYQTYRIAERQFGEVGITADFNTIRKELGLPLSSFVTGGESRQSFIRSMESEKETDQPMPEEDIPYSEELGFTFDTISNFYAHDLVSFYKEKTIGKAESTVRKYKNSLNVLREALANHRLIGWEHCDSLFWEQLLTKDLFEIDNKMTKTQLNDFISTIRTFGRWLDHTKHTAIFDQVVKVIDETKKQVVH